MSALPRGCNNNNCNNSTYAVTPLISNFKGVAPNTYPQLKNPWELVVANGSIWITDELAGTLVNFSFTGALLNTVTVAPGADDSEIALPRGLAVNTSSSITSGSPASPVLLLISTRQGTINVYNPAVSTTIAPVVINNSAKDYRYASILVANNQIYVANASTKVVEIYSASYSSVGKLEDESLVSIGAIPVGLMTPYPMGPIYVTFSAPATVSTALPLSNIGRGFVDVFSPDGSSSSRLINRGHLDVPHAMAIIPIPLTINGVSQIFNALAIGNRGTGQIVLYDPLSGSYIGTLNDVFGNAIVIDEISSLVNIGSSILYLSGTEVYRNSTDTSGAHSYGQIGYLTTLTQVLMEDQVVTKSCKK